jgi:hypothetical protein
MPVAVIKRASHTSLATLFNVDRRRPSRNARFVERLTPRRDDAKCAARRTALRPRGFMFVFGLSSLGVASGVGAPTRALVPLEVERC